MGVFWVYFKKEGSELKLEIEAENRVEAVQSAEDLAETMRSVVTWQYSHTIQAEW